MKKTELTVKNKTGLHARPASRFVQKASSFEADIKIKNGEKEANAKSIMGVMSLGIGQGSNIIIEAEGSDEQEAITSLQNFIEVELLQEEDEE